MTPIAVGDRAHAATAIFYALIGHRLSDKYKAVELLNEAGRSIDLALLRTLLQNAIKKEFYPGKEVEQNDGTIAVTRSWLLGTLARISAGDDEATALVAKHVHRNPEPYQWARYWSLEGLISGKNIKAEAVARTVADVHDDPMVSMLATALLASLHDQKATQKIVKSLDEHSMQWFVLRALRIVPHPATVETICELVEAAASTDETYDAIMALGKIPSDWSHSTRASQALSACIVKMRGAPWKDGMRTGAINGLGNLKVESSGPLIIEELTDDNPAVVREAARSIERILGLHVTVIRIVEAASKADAAGVDAYARALRWLNRKQVADELDTLMTSGPATQQEVARTLMSEIGGAIAFDKLRARTDAMKQYTDVLEKTEARIRDLFDESVREAQGGFRLAAIMDVVVFAVGVVLLLGSAGYALFSSGDLAKWAGVGLSGGVGVLGVVYGVLIANPRRQVQDSVDHLMRVKIVFLAYLRRLHQTDQAYTRRLLDDELITVEELKGFADIVGTIMKDTVQQQLDGTHPDADTHERPRSKDGDRTADLMRGQTETSVRPNEARTTG